MGPFFIDNAVRKDSPERAAEGKAFGTLRQCRAFGLDCRYISAARQHASRGRRKVMRVGTSSVGTPGARSCTAHACHFHFQMALWVRVRVTGPSSMRPGVLRLLGLGASPAAGLCALQAATARRTRCHSARGCRGSTSSLWFFFTLGGRKIALFGRR